MEFKVHHIGYAVPDVGEAIAEFSKMGWKNCGGVTEDLSRQVRIAFLEHDGCQVELVAPLSDQSPIRKILQKGSGRPYHFCYEVSDLASAEEKLKRAGFILFKKAAEAPAIGGRRVEFMYAKNMGIVELVEVVA